jgi:carboxypeptidase Q
MSISRRFFSFIIFLLPVMIFAQDEKIDTAMIKRIREEGLNHSQVSQIAHYLTDVAGSRLTNSSGYRRAGNWVVGTLQKWGLDNTKLEPWGDFGYGWDVDKSTLALKSPYYEPIIAYPSPWCGSTNGTVTTDVFLLEKNDSLYIEKNADLIKGKIVLLGTRDTLLPGDFKPDATRYTDSELVKLADTYMIPSGALKMFMPIIKKMISERKLLMQKGAAGILSVSFGGNGRDGTVFVDGFGGYLKKDQPQLPEMIMSSDACFKIERLIHSGHTVRMEMDVSTRLLSDDLKGYNVVGEIAGTDPTLKAEVVMLGGHMDSWQSATGATDNGAGCIASLEAIRILKALGIKPKRTIRIALWGGEEQGLIGSFHYVKNHYGDPATMQLKPEQDKVSAYYNLDNGSGKIRGIFDQSNDAVVPIFKKWLEPFDDLGATMVTRHNTGSTDHLSFDAVGIPGFQFIQDPLDYETRTHHSNMDNYDHLNLNDLKQASTILAAFVYNTAMWDKKLPRKPLPKPEKFIFEEFEEAFQ